MREKLEKYVNEHYTNVRVWEYVEINGECQLRFTTGNDLYLITILKAGSHATVFKREGNVLI